MLQVVFCGWNEGTIHLGKQPCQNMILHAIWKSGARLCSLLLPLYIYLLLSSGSPSVKRGGIWALSCCSAVIFHSGRSQWKTTKSLQFHNHHIHIRAVSSVSGCNITDSHLPVIDMQSLNNECCFHTFSAPVIESALYTFGEGHRLLYYFTVRGAFSHFVHTHFSQHA